MAARLLLLAARTRVPAVAGRNFMAAPTWARFMSSGTFQAASQGTELVPVLSEDTGFVRMVVPLPSTGNTRFSLTPSSTLGLFLDDIKREDDGVVSIGVFNEEGIAIASNTPLSELEAEPVQLLINDRKYTFELPEFATAVSTPVASGSPLSGRLEQTLQLLEAQHSKRQHLMAEISQIKDELKPLEDIRAECQVKAHDSGKKLAWVGLGVMGLQFGFLARLTWFEYSWDLMEPVTYFITTGTQMLFMCYYLISQREYTYEVVQERAELKSFYNRAKAQGMSIERYNQLKDKLSDYENQLKQL
eukprot:m.136555 g.136555  ORF g.136555 m.136555 type:complete len:303 (+) comp14000_c0_seq2:329-1237(+)